MGDIDLVWGKVGDPAKDYKGGYGLAKIAAKHPEVLRDLQAHISETRLVEQNGTWATLESADKKAVVRLDWDGKEKRWLVSAYEKGTGGGRTSDIAALAGKDDTAPLTAGSNANIAQTKAKPQRPDDLIKPTNDDGTLYANPFPKAAKTFARDVIAHPGRSAAEAFVGGVAGATTSDEETGSAKWWLDVARGATLGMVGLFQSTPG